MYQQGNSRVVNDQIWYVLGHIIPLNINSTRAPFDALEQKDFWKYYEEWNICSCSIFHNIFKTIEM